jgi:hypothetical protein
MIAWLLALALAGDIYVNDVKVNPMDLQGITLEKVDVAIDDAGNMRIHAPGYKIEVVGNAEHAAPSAPSGNYGSATYQSPNQAPQAPQPSYPPGAYGGYNNPVPPPAQPPPAGPAPLDANVPQATWWLVTQDDGSTGHVVEVWVNGRLAETVRSGEAQRIVDIGRHLKRGANEVRISSESTNPAGGSLYIYLGKGGDREGTVTLPEPQVQHGVGRSRQGAYERSYTVNL